MTLRARIRPWPALLALLLMSLASRPAAGAGPGLEGSWQGTIVVKPGQHEVDLEARFERGKDGGWSGVMSVPTQEVKDQPLESIELDGERRVFWVYRDASGPALMSGVIAADGRTITGRDQEGRDSYPLRLVRVESVTPTPPLGELPSVDSFRQLFDRDLGKTRLVLVLAPSCGLCQEGARLVERYVLARHPNEPLAVDVIWVPISRQDNREVARRATVHLTDPRARHYWNGDLSVANALRPAVGLASGPAWDVYLVYGPGQHWDGAAPAPEYFMHRLSNDLPRERRFDAIKLEGEVAKILAAVRR